jgi:DNA-binding GntR family transcriptional regulator
MTLGLASLAPCGRGGSAAFPQARASLRTMTVGDSHRTLREVVADEIRGMIMRGELEPGEHLPEDRLAEQLGVSRNPVREAIRALEGTGLVEVVPRRGAHVSRIEPEQVVHLLELRSVLEAFAARRAASRRTDSDLADLQRCIDVGRAASEADNMVTAAQCHREFHIVVERASGNEYLESVVAPLRHQTELVFTMLAELRGLTSWHEHQAIHDAIAAGDAEWAEAATASHMDNVIEGIRSRMTEVAAS